MLLNVDQVGIRQFVVRREILPGCLVVVGNCSESITPHNNIHLIITAADRICKSAKERTADGIVQKDSSKDGHHHNMSCDNAGNSMLTEILPGRLKFRHTFV